MRFSVRGFGCAPFLYQGGNMDKNAQKKVIDISGIELTPGAPSACLGNGMQGFLCCCDECDYFLLCFPEFDSQVKEKSTVKNNGRI